MTDGREVAEPDTQGKRLGYISAYGLEKLQTRNHYCVSVSNQAGKEYVIPIFAETPPPQTQAAGLYITEWERSRLSQYVAGNDLTYMGHHARGGLKPHEIEEMERWEALSNKLKTPSPQTMALGPEPTP